MVRWAWEVPPSSVQSVSPMGAAMTLVCYYRCSLSSAKRMSLAAWEEHRFSVRIAEAVFGIDPRPSRDCCGNLAVKRMRVPWLLAARQHPTGVLVAVAAAAGKSPFVDESRRRDCGRSPVGRPVVPSTHVRVVSYRAEEALVVVADPSSSGSALNFR